MAGVRIPPYEHTLAPTPPPDIDVEAWLDSLHTVAGWNPQSLCLTHFGQVTDVAEQLHRDPHGARRRRPTPPGSTARSASSPGSRARSAPSPTPRRWRPTSRPRRPTSSTRASSATGASGPRRRDRDRRAAARGGAGQRARRQLARDRAERRPQHLRGRGRRAVARRCPASATTRAWRWPTRSTTSGQAIVWTGAREPAEHYWEQLKEAGSRWPRWSRARRSLAATGSTASPGRRSPRTSAAAAPGSSPTARPASSAISSEYQ